MSLPQALLSDATDEELRPLAGVRVLDLTASLAGPWCTKFLADLGCEVIKVESCENYDLTRGPSGSEDWRAYGKRGTDRPYECADTFLKPNRGKIGCTLDLKHPEGNRLFRELLRTSDVLVENFAAGHMSRFGLDYEAMKAINPKIIYATMPSLGSFGPEKDYVGYGNTVECLSGLASMTGYQDEAPMVSEMWLGDPTGAIHATGAIVLALYQREITGDGQMVELSQVESLSAWLGEAFMDYVLNGRRWQPIGNADRAGAVPNGCYPCLGEDEWLTVAVRNDADWTSLCAAVGDGFPEAWKGLSWSRRRTMEPGISERLSAWTSSRTKGDAMAALQAHGVPAGAVLVNKDLFEDRHLEATGFFESITHPYAGTHAYPGTPWLINGRRPVSRSAAPMLGEHNDYVLGELLGLDEHQIKSLEQEGVIGTEPTTDRWGG